MAQSEKNGNGSKPQIDVQYEQRTAVYASQFILNGADDELVMDCSSGVVLESQDGHPVMPIHTRLAMSWGAAKRLTTLLNQALRNHESQQASVPTGNGGSKYAKLPSIDDR